MNTYNELDENQQAEFIAKLIVVIQKDEVSFHDAQKIVKHGERIGIFDNIKIGHHAVYQENNLLTTTK